MTQQLRACAALAETRVQFPVPILGCSQPPITPDPMPLASETISTLVHMSTCKPTYIYKINNIINLFLKERDCRDSSQYHRSWLSKSRAMEQATKKQVGTRFPTNRSSCAGPAHGKNSPSQKPQLWFWGFPADWIRPTWIYLRLTSQ